MAALRDQIKAILDFRTPTPSSDFFQLTSAHALSIGEAAIAANPGTFPNFKVTDYSYRSNPYDVRRFGAVGDGVTDDTIAIQNAFDVVRFYGGTVFFPMPPVTYLVTSPLNLTFTTAAAQPGFTVRGEGTQFNDIPTITAKHTGHIFDCTGATGINFVDLSIGTDASTFPKDCFFLARCNTIAGNNSQVHRFTNCWVNGKFSVANSYNYGSEDIIYVGCKFWNHATGATAVAVITRNNAFGLTSTFATVRTGNQSTIDHQIFGGIWANLSGNAASDVFYLDGVSHLRIYGPWVLCGDPASTGGRSIVYVDQSVQDSSYITLHHVESETLPTQNAYGVFFTNNAQTPTQWNIDSCYLPAATNAVFAGALVTLNSFYVRKLAQAANTGISATKLEFSTIDCGPMALTLGTSKQNTLIGSTENWAITTRTNDFWIDAGITNKSWTANLAGITVTGAVTRFEQHCLVYGNMVTVTITLSAATSIASTAGTNFIQGLPYPVAFRSAQVSVCNETTHVFIGGGMVETDNKIWLPTIAAGANVVITITASYFAA